MVGRDVRVDRDGGAPRERRQLELGELDDDPVLGGELGQPFDERRADVPAEERRVEGVGREDGVSERGGRRLALRPGHPDRRRGAEPEEQVGLGRERGRRRVAGGPARDEPGERGP